MTADLKRKRIKVSLSIVEMTGCCWNQPVASGLVSRCCSARSSAVKQWESATQPLTVRIRNTLRQQIFLCGRLRGDFSRPISA
jgi:hypothetical protein